MSSIPRSGVAPRKNGVQELIDDLRSRINPVYAARIGTESYERRLCAEALETQSAENERLREQIKCGHSMELDALARERDELLVENERLKAIENIANEFGIVGFVDIEELREQLAAAQAKIDSLMLEYCPDEMTPEQIENWGKHQKAVSDQTNLPLQLSP